jgi:hypothetical protein
LECGGPLELDDYVIDESLRGRGIRGRVSATLIPDILKAMEANKEIAPKDKETIRAFLSPLMAVHPQLPGSGAAGPAQSGPA